MPKAAFDQHPHIEVIVLAHGGHFGAETIRIGREAKLPVHISHIKALGPEIWNRSGQAIKLIKKARSAGVAGAVQQLVPARSH